MWLDLINVGAVVFVLGSVWPVYRRFGVPSAALILVNVLPPLSFGGVLSMGRLTSVLFPTFLWLGRLVFRALIDRGDGALGERHD